VTKIRPNEYLVECFRPGAQGDEILVLRRTAGSLEQAQRLQAVWLRGDWEA
jgi:hypothetical protein